MKHIPWISVIPLLLVFTDHPARADAGAAASLFQQGRTQLSLGAGYGNFNNNGYFVADLGGGYYLLDGLEAGLDGEAWLGSQPQIYINSGGARVGLIFPLSPKAYLGAGLVYEHYFNCDTTVYSSCDDLYPEATIAFSF
jgi:hypothetical protein